MPEPRRDIPQPRALPDIGVTPEHFGFPVVGVLGHPETARPGSTRLTLTTQALRSLNDLLNMVGTPQEAETGIIKEFGFGGLGLTTDNGRGILISHFLPAPDTIPSGVATKTLDTAFFIKLLTTADDYGLGLVATGHDHHEVASNAPSGVDLQALNAPSRVEFITRRTRYPYPISAWRWNDSSKAFDHISGLQIINTDGTPQAEIDALIARFGYAASDGVTLTHIQPGRTVEGHVNQVAPSRLSPPVLPPLITIDFDEDFPPPPPINDPPYIEITQADLDRAVPPPTVFSISLNDLYPPGLLATLWKKLVGKS